MTGKSNGRFTRALAKKRLGMVYQSSSVEETQNFAETLSNLAKDLFDHGRYTTFPYKTSHLHILPIGLKATSGTGKSVLSRAFVQTLSGEDGISIKNEEDAVDKNRKLQVWNVASDLSHFFQIRAYDAAFANNRPNFMEKIPERYCDGIEMIEHPHRSLLYKKSPRSSRIVIELDTITATQRQINVIVPRATPAEREICDHYLNGLMHS